MLTYDQAHEAFEYRDGALYWKTQAQGRQMGRPVGRTTREGYRQVKIYGKCYQVHRVIWLMEKGVWPKADLDHENREKGHNRLENLREVTPSQNAHNREYADGELPRGVSLANGKYLVRVRLNTKRVSRRFYDLQAALDWRDIQLESVWR